MAHSVASGGNGPATQARAVTQVAIGLYGLQNWFGGDFAPLTEVVRVADRAGIDLLSITDHVVMGENTHEYPYGRCPAPMDYPWFEPTITLASPMYEAGRRDGRSSAGLRRLLADNGLTVHAIDPLIGALPGTPRPADVPPQNRSYFEITEEDCYRAADDLEAQTINLAHFGGSAVTEVQFIDCLGPLAERARGHGVGLTLEFLPREFDPGSCHRPAHRHRHRRLQPGADVRYLALRAHQRHAHAARGPSPGTHHRAADQRPPPAGPRGPFSPPWEGACCPGKGNCPRFSG